MKTIKPITISLWNKTITSLLCAAVLLCSCDSFVEVDLPSSQLTSKTVFENYNTADAALVDIYAKIRDNGLLSGSASGLCFLLGTYADELAYYGSPSDPALHFYTNSLLASNDAVAQFWNMTYSQIYAANAVLQGSEKSLSLSATEKKKLQGEALFIRALLHFYLVNLYGEIPYITTTDYTVNSSAGKLPQAKVYEQIIADLQSSITLLSSAAPDQARVRPSKWAAAALLARVYLYQGSWPEAANSASSLINETASYVIEGPQKTFLKDSKETIWQLQPALAGKNTDQAATFIFFTGPPPLVALSDELARSFSGNDLRKTHWTGSVTTEGSTWYYAYKYKEFDFTPTTLEYPVVFRLAEQCLIRAEARAQQGDLIGSKEDLNRVRNRAGLSPVTALSKEELLDAVYQERRWEFFTEYGHRFFDLKRSGQINSVLAAVKPGWSPTAALFPLPQTELSLNPNLRPQNAGY